MRILYRYLKYLYWMISQKGVISSLLVCLM